MIKPLCWAPDGACICRQVIAQQRWQHGAQGCRLSAKQEQKKMWDAFRKPVRRRRGQQNHSSARGRCGCWWGFDRMVLVYKALETANDSGDAQRRSRRLRRWKPSSATQGACACSQTGHARRCRRYCTDYADVENAGTKQLQAKISEPEGVSRQTLHQIPEM
jgi:hypothetical protein